MSSKSFRRFLRDESGGYTIWSLIWFSLYVAMGGVAVDMTDAYRNQTLLQSTADASSLAAVMSLPDQDDGTAQALAYAADNMNPAINGNVLKAAEVIFGNWDFAGKEFTPGTASPNAVRVITRRDDSNLNPLGTNFLRIIGLQQWNISVEAIAARYVPNCINDGFVALGQVYFTSNNHFWRHICIHGQNDGVAGRVGQSSYESGVAISVGYDDGVGFPGGALNQPDLQAAIAQGGVGTLMPKDVEYLGDIIYGLRTMDPNYLPDFMVDIAVDGVRTARLGESAIGYETSLPANLADMMPMTVYYITDCGQLNLGNALTQVVIVTDCKIHASGDMSAGDVVLASSYVGGSPSIHMAAKSGLGRDDDDCDSPAGDVALYTNGSVKMAAQGKWYGLRIVAGEDVNFTANNDGAWGIAVQAGGDIRFTSNSHYGLCDGAASGRIEWHYRLVR